MERFLHSKLFFTAHRPAFSTYYFQALAPDSPPSPPSTLQTPPPPRPLSISACNHCPRSAGDGGRTPPRPEFRGVSAAGAAGEPTGRRLPCFPGDRWTRTLRRRMTPPSTSTRSRRGRGPRSRAAPPHPPLPSPRRRHPMNGIPFLVRRCCHFESFHCVVGVGVHVAFSLCTAAMLLYCHPAGLAILTRWSGFRGCRVFHFHISDLATAMLFGPNQSDHFSLHISIPAKGIIRHHSVQLVSFFFCVGGLITAQEVHA